MIHNHNNDLVVQMFHTSTDACWCFNITKETLKMWQEYQNHIEIKYGKISTIKKYFDLTSTNKVVA